MAELVSNRNVGQKRGKVAVENKGIPEIFQGQAGKDVMDSL